MGSASQIYQPGCGPKSFTYNSDNNLCKICRKSMAKCPNLIIPKEEFCFLAFSWLKPYLRITGYS
jgi:hypothetical protein